MSPSVHGPSTPRSHMVSYIAHDHDDASDWAGCATDTKHPPAPFIQAAVDWVISVLRADGWTVTDEKEDHPNHPGWDLTSRRTVEIESILGEKQGTCEEVKYIEVKAKQGVWDDWGIGLTPKQHEKALEYGRDHYLYVVEYTGDPVRRHVYVFRDPANTITTYRLDSHWRDAANDSIAASAGDIVSQP